MSNLSRQCCCGEGSACSAFCCASSYAVSNFTFPYTFEKTITGTSSVDCGQGYCFRRSYTIELTITKDLPFVVNRTTLAGGTCCYRGTGYVTVTGQVTIVEAYDGISSLCPPPFNAPYAQTHVYTFEWQVCACITVNCVTKLDHCTGVTVPALQHTLEIGDFVVWCNHEGWEGDCDTCPVFYGPFEIRSVGARLAWSSDVKCLTAVGEKNCLGWYPPTQQYCGGEGTECYAALEDNAALHGPFGLVLRPECSAGRDDDPCIDQYYPNKWCPTIGFGEPPAIAVQLRSPCANVDTDYNPCNTINVAVRQQGGCPMFWSYS